jgi:hypothetical protein
MRAKPAPSANVFHITILTGQLSAAKPTLAADFIFPSQREDSFKNK